jgi:hypothetical protein
MSGNTTNGDFDFEPDGCPCRLFRCRANVPTVLLLVIFPTRVLYIAAVALTKRYYESQEISFSVAKVTFFTLTL